MQQRGDGAASPDGGRAAHIVPGRRRGSRECQAPTRRALLHGVAGSAEISGAQFRAAVPASRGLCGEARLGAYKEARGWRIAPGTRRKLPDDQILTFSYRKSTRGGLHARAIGRFHLHPWYFPHWSLSPLLLTYWCFLGVPISSLRDMPSPRVGAHAALLLFTATIQHTVPCFSRT